MTRKEYKEYLKEMEISGLLPLIYNGWRYINNMNPLDFVTLDLVLADNKFIDWNKKELENEANIWI